jgi:phosphatidylserine decarboxylase
MRPRSLPVPLAPEGLPFLLPPAIVAVAILPLGGGWSVAAGVLLLLAALVAWFFRDPERTAPDGPGLIVSPADGRVMRVGPAEPSFEAPPGLTQAVTIFLGIQDVHVNRSPASGRIETVCYRPGSFVAAFREEASRGNERNEVALATPDGPVAFRQVAGAVARRIVFHRSPGDAVERGERVGMIRFGSRVDIFLPPSFRVEVAPGRKVRAGETILARLAAACP